MSKEVIDSVQGYLTSGLGGAGLAVGFVSWEELLNAFVLGIVGGAGGLLLRWAWKRIKGK